MGEPTTGREQGDEQVAAVWRAHRSYLIGVAFRMLGRIGDAEDAVQEAFARLMRAGLDGIDDVRGWLVVVVSRVCVDQLRSARARYEDVGDELALALGNPVTLEASPADPADRVTLDESIRAALARVLDRLSPAERTAFVLHDVFGFPFDAVASIVGRTPSACRQLASRARRRVRDSTGPERFAPDLTDQYRVSERFIAACAGGDLAALLELLSEDVVGHADLAAGGSGQAGRTVVGRAAVARNGLTVFDPTRGVTLVPQLVNGRAGMFAFRGQTLFAVVEFSVSPTGLIEHIEAVVDPARLAALSSVVSGRSEPVR